MKPTYPAIHLASLATIAWLAGAYALCSTNLQAAETNEPPSIAVPAQRLFATPDDAINALRAATESKDTAGLHDIFGPEVQDLLTGDPVQDANNAQRFAVAMAEGCTPVKAGDNEITLEVGTNNWPMPIPLVQTNGQWYFDTAAGKEEIINRHVGKDELCAIGVCRDYVKAQLQYADANPRVGGGPQYALKFKSSPGKKDGLYWPVADNEPASPFGPLVAEAHAQGYGNSNSTGLHAFHGYYFRILTRQGKAAPGGRLNYLSEGSLVAGFALVAYPEHWGQSGIMTFIVGQDGKVYQQDFGEKTARIAEKMKEYNPDTQWTLVQDQGILSAVSEK